MSDELKDFATTPTLTFDVTPQTENASPAASAGTDLSEKAQDPAFSENNLTPEELQMVENFSHQIDISNSQAILQYGVGTQKKMADFSETALKNVRTKDMGEVGEMLSSLVTELKSFDVDETETGFRGFFKRSANTATALKTQYATAEVNVNQVCASLEGHQQLLLKDIALLDKMYEVNLTYFKELSMYILAGKKKLQEVREGELKAAIQRAQQSKLPEDAQAAKDQEKKFARVAK